jgi:hypothetical protein
MSETVPEIRISTDAREVEKLSKEGFKLRETITPYNRHQGEQVQFILERGSEASSAKAWTEADESRKALDLVRVSLKASEQRVGDLERTEQRTLESHKRLRAQNEQRSKALAEMRGLRDRAVARGTAIETQLGQARNFFGAQQWAEFEKKHPRVAPPISTFVDVEVNTGLATPTREEVLEAFRSDVAPRIGTAQGTQLDRVAQLVGLERKLGPSGAAETDAFFRARISAEYEKHTDRAVHREAAERLAGVR